MRITHLLAAIAAAFPGVSIALPSTIGIEGLVQRRMPNHADQFVFSLTSDMTGYSTSNISKEVDEYTISNGPNGKIQISGNSPIALASGLRYYLTNYARVDIYWYPGSQLDQAPMQLPPINSTYRGKSIVPWRYHFNTVTFSYTTAFWTWEDWSLELDWLALHGVNLPLAWVGFEKILVEVFLEAGFTEADISSFLSGPAFQAWNRFGNIQGSWGGKLPMSWINSQYMLQKKIIKRISELGMTPVLPCFTGFVPEQIGRIYPNSSFVNGSAWSGFPANYTNVTFLEPFDPLFTKLQKNFISKQKAAYGNVTSFYTLDQYNENNPYSGDLTYLHNVSSNTFASLKAADSSAIWMIQGWLFYSSESFWTSDKIEAYLGGVNNSSMVILDLFSESQPQWQRTNNYYGKPWIWCQLHDYGGNMGLYGQVQNATMNPVQALSNQSSTMVGMGLTMEGQETVPCNQIMYNILLDQAWSQTPINVTAYFHEWVTVRYSGINLLPEDLYNAWQMMSETVYNNTDLAVATAVTKSILELAPNTTGLLNRTGHHATTIQYSPTLLVKIWSKFYNAATKEPGLWGNAAYIGDLSDLTRQVVANAFDPLYTAFVSASNSSLNSSYSPSTAKEIGQKMLDLLADLDTLLFASGQSYFQLKTWISEARVWSHANSFPNENIAKFYEYDARNQVTLWGPTGEISDYASKQWAGLIRSYYIPRWQRFIAYTLNSTTSNNGENPGLSASLLAFEESWQRDTDIYRTNERYGTLEQGNIQDVVAGLVNGWPSVFSSS